MARKAQEGADPRPKPTDHRVMVIALKGSTEFREWLSGVSRRSRIPASTIVEVALVEWAARNGHDAPPER